MYLFLPAPISDLLHPTEWLLISNQLPRLEAMRRRYESRSDVTFKMDLLTRLIYDDSFLAHAHNIERWGRQFWASPGTTTGSHCVDQLKHAQRCPDSLFAAELEWQRANVALDDDSEDNDEFWAAHWRESQEQCETMNRQLKNCFDEANPHESVISAPEGSSGRGWMMRAEECANVSC